MAGNFARRSGLALHPLEQTFCGRDADSDWIQHSDQGVRCLSIAYITHLIERGLVPSVGSVGGTCGIVLAEKVSGLFRTEVIRQNGPCAARRC